VVLLIGLIGGIAWPRWPGPDEPNPRIPISASTNPSDLTMFVLQRHLAVPWQDPFVDETISHLAGVERVVTAIGPEMVPLAANGAPRLSTLSNVVIRAAWTE